jgi:predicted DCC family thiol-disulfide oxidoreductase YuxK
MNPLLRPSPWAPRPAQGLPDGTILFDGVCAFCSAWVRFVVERDRGRVFSFAAIQSPAGRRLADLLLIDPERPETNAVVLDGMIYFKSDAALAVLARLPGWRWTHVLALAPRVLRDFLYDPIARNRYALWGRTESCMIPTPALRDRFVPDGLP